MFAVRLVQEDTVKTGLSRKSVHKQEVFARKITHSNWWKRHHTNQAQNYMAKHVIWLLRNGEVVGGMVAKE